MKYEDAVEALKRGRKVTRQGRIFELRRGIVDVTDEEPVRVQFTDEERAAADWEAV